MLLTRCFHFVDIFNNYLTTAKCFEEGYHYVKSCYRYNYEWTSLLSLVNQGPSRSYTACA